MIEIPLEYPGREEAKVIFAKVMLAGVVTPKLREISFYQCHDQEIKVYWQAFRDYVRRELTGSYNEQ